MVMDEIDTCIIISLYTEIILSTLLKILIHYCSVPGQNRVHCSVYICSLNLYIFQSKTWIMILFIILRNL